MCRKKGESWESSSSPLLFGYTPCIYARYINIIPNTYTNTCMDIHTYVEGVEKRREKNSRRVLRFRYINSLLWDVVRAKRREHRVVQILNLIKKDVYKCVCEPIFFSPQCNSAYSGRRSVFVSESFFLS